MVLTETSESSGVFEQKVKVVRRSEAATFARDAASIMGSEGRH
jgi:hypothetical protein